MKVVTDNSLELRYWFAVLSMILFMSDDNIIIIITLRIMCTVMCITLMMNRIVIFVFSVSVMMSFVVSGIVICLVVITVANIFTTPVALTQCFSSK